MKLNKDDRNETQSIDFAEKKNKNPDIVKKQGTAKITKSSANDQKE